MMERRRPSASWVCSVLCALLLVAIGAACRGGPETVEPAWLPGAEQTGHEPPPRPFSGRAALADARRLAEFEATASDPEGTERAAAWLAELLAGMGAETGVVSLGAHADARRAEGAAFDPTIVGVLPGRSDDAILLMADYAAPEDADAAARLDAASGAGVVLELGRALASRPRPYTVWLGFVHDGAGVDVAVLKQRVRLAVLFESLADPELRVVRDLRSQRVHRESFWDSARALGLETVFVPDASFGTPEALHRPLAEAGYRAVVAVVGETDALGALDEPEPPGVDASDDEAERAATATRLDELGAVTLDALDGIAERLSRIDGFAVAPLSTERWEDEWSASDADDADNAKSGDGAEGRDARGATAPSRPEAAPTGDPDVVPRGGDDAPTPPADASGGD